jgi:hypothetical protein
MRTKLTAEQLGHGLSQRPKPTTSRASDVLTTTDCIKLLKSVEFGASGRAREIGVYVDDGYLDTPKISIRSTGDGVAGAQVCLDIVSKRVSDKNVILSNRVYVLSYSICTNYLRLLHLRNAEPEVWDERSDLYGSEDRDDWIKRYLELKTKPYVKNIVAYSSVLQEVDMKEVLRGI